MATVSETIPELTRERALALYRGMVVIRRTEEGLAKAHAAGLIQGACHTYVGEEAVATGVSAHLRPDDTVLSTHRGHGHALAKGVPPRELMAELFGRATGCSRGRGGSMHLFAPEIGLLGTSGIVGPSILMATGAGYTYRLLGTDRVSVAFFGDGAANNGAFHEGLNLAAIWRLPVLFVCENNLYATEVPFESVAGNPNVAARGAAYGLPSVRVDGNDVLAVHEAAGEAVRRARARGRTDAARMPHLPDPGPLRGHARRWLPDAGRGGPVEGPLPARALARPAAGRRRGGGRGPGPDRPGGGRARGGGRPVRRGEPVARSRERDAPRVRGDGETLGDARARRSPRRRARG